MDRSDWDERYAGSELVWSATPNMFVEQVCEGLPPGRALDLGAGEGRNGLWLAERGWDVTAVDFSRVALDRAESLADQRLPGSERGRFTTVASDLRDLVPSVTYDLVLVVYVQVPPGDRALVLRAAAAAVAVGGRLLVVAHHSDNLAEGVGGPRDPAVLYTEDVVVADLGGCGLVTERAERALRRVGDADAVDALVLARRDG